MDYFSPAPADNVALHQRTNALVALFERIHTGRMQGVPILNHSLRVAAVGFAVTEPEPATAGNTASAMSPPGATGILITPWFMNLLRFNVKRLDQPERAGSSSTYTVGTTPLDFIAGYEADFGSYAACSLFSPVFEFSDQSTAVATAYAILAELRRPEQPTMPPTAALAGAPDRRAFLFGRRSPPRGLAP